MSVANPINAPAGGLNQGCWKRKGSEEDDDDVETNVKKARYSWYVTLESESPQPTSSDEDDESVHSVQAQETEYVQDTSDTSTNTWIGDNVVHVEYDVATSLSGDEDPFIDGLSSSDPEDFIKVTTIEAAIYDSDVDLADDSDDSWSSLDSAISHADYSECVQCSGKNNNPFFRYCNTCYGKRKNFFPPRPKGRKRRPNVSKRKPSQEPTDGHELVALDSGLGSSQGSQSLTFDFKPLEPERTSYSVHSGGRRTGLSLSQESTDTVDIGFSASQASTISLSQTSETSLSQPNTSFTSLSQSSQEQLAVTSKNDENRIEIANESNELNNSSQESVVSVATTLSVDGRDSNQSDLSENSDALKSRIPPTKSELPIDPDGKFCIMCTVGPKNGVFVHGQISHICCCYRCAKIVWKTNKHCPMCNRKVMNVLKAHYA